MNFRFLKQAAVPAVVLVAVATGCRGGESEEPPVHLIFNMDTQEKGRPYRRDTSGLFADGRVMQLPPEGTIAHGQLVEDAVLTDGSGDADGGVPSIEYPAVLKADGGLDALKARGAIRYQIYCSPCHGRDLDGKGPVASKGLPVPPPSFHAPRLKEMPVGKIYSAIKNGVNNGNMPPYAHQIPVVDRWAIVAYVRKAQMEKDPSVKEEGGETGVVAVAEVASLEHGTALFKAKGCNACHTLDGNRLVGPSFKGLFGKTEATSAGDVPVDDAYLKESIVEPNAKVVTSYPPAMPKLQFSPIEVDSLVLFIKAQK